MLVVGTTCTVLHTSMLGAMSFSPPAPKELDHLRLMTFNIAHGRGLAVDQRLVPDAKFEENLDHLAAFINEARADIVALQEVDQDSSWNGNFDHLAYLMEGSGMPHSAYGLNNRNEGRYKLNYGNATLSRHTIIDETHQAFGDATLGEKGFLHTRVQVQNTEVDVINLHLDFRSEKRRRHQIRQLVSFIREGYEAAGDDYIFPFIVGDFNSEISKDEGATQLLLTELQTMAPYSVVPTSDQHTFSVYHPASTIDLVYVPPQFVVQAVQVMPVRLSDHLPVIVDLLPADELAAEPLPADQLEDLP